MISLWVFPIFRKEKQAKQHGGSLEVTSVAFNERTGVPSLKAISRSLTFNHTMFIKIRHSILNPQKIIFGSSLFFEVETCKAAWGIIGEKIHLTVH